MQPYLAGLRERWPATLAAAGRPLRISVAAGVRPTGASEAAATQILDALLDNTARHGRGDVDVRAAADADADAVVIDVTNEGPPVAVGSPELFRVRMGLSLARRLADSEGGRLTLPAKTPTFTLLLTYHKGFVTRPVVLGHQMRQRRDHRRVDTDEHFYCEHWPASNGSSSCGSSAALT